MSDNPNANFDDRLDTATARRLGRLGTMPVDTTRLESRLCDELGLASSAPTAADAARRGRVYAIVHSARAIAASVAVLFLLGVVLLYTTTAPVSASPRAMVQLHQDLVSGRAAATQVDSIEAANRELAAQWPGSPALPGVPPQHVMACCMKSVDHKRVACVLLEGQPSPVTMMVAKASDMRPPRDARSVTRDGVTYFTHEASTDGVNMVSFSRDGRYVCLIASLPTDRLIDLGSQLKF